MLSGAAIADASAGATSAVSSRDSTLAKYACDACRSRKVACSREFTGCRRCRAEGISCIFSRSGVIRRSKKLKERSTTTTVDQSDGAARHSETTTPATEHAAGPAVHIPGPAQGSGAAGTAHERLQQLTGNNAHSLKAVALLLEECAAAWQSSVAFDELSKDAQKVFITFDEAQAGHWSQALIDTLEEQNLLITLVPAGVLDQLRASNFQSLVHDPAWLIMFHAIAIAGTDASDKCNLAKLKSNLWLAFNDVKLLLEPRISSVQALFILATSLERFMTPSVCCSLIQTCCSMLQAVGINHTRLDATTIERRTIFFWRLNFAEKALALILNRPPLLHRDTTAMIAMPTLDQLFDFRPKVRALGLFLTHYSQQTYLLSRVMGDIWYCVYGQDHGKEAVVKQELDSWYQKADQILQAAALAEKPLMSAKDAASVDSGLQSLRFHYMSMMILITIPKKDARNQTADSAQELLNLLPHLDSTTGNSRTANSTILWQYMHFSLAAFGTLWGQIVMKGRAQRPSSEIEHLLCSIERLPEFLEALSARHHIARTLQSVTTRMVQHTKSLIHGVSETENANPSVTQDASFPQPGCMSTTSGELFPAPSMPEMGDMSFDNLNNFTSWSDLGFFDPTFDWLTWGHEQQTL